MKHLGDITKINGSEIPVVDIITGGSPCQDLSVAGLRKGLQHNELGDEETTRSGLFMDQLRIVKEMRANDVCNGRSGIDVRPRYMVWENVPGAFSVNQGKDFQAVLTEIVRVIEPTAPDVPLPEKGWPYAGCIYDELGGWSIAYRVHDAQFWGVPQRRRRIALVADFNGLSAAEILFDPQLRGETESSQPDKAVRDPGKQRGREVPSVCESLSGHSEPGGEAREGATESTTGGIDGTSTDGCGAGCHDRASADGNALSFQERAGKPGGARDYSCNVNTSEPCQRSKTSQSSPDSQEAYGICSYDSNAMKSTNPHSGFYKADTSRTLDLNGGNPACNQGGGTRSSTSSGGGLPQRYGKPFCERDSASEGARSESEQQQRGQGPDAVTNTKPAQFFQNTGHGWWNESNTAETVRTPGGATRLKQTLSCANPLEESQAADLYNGTVGGGTATLTANTGQSASHAGPSVLTTFFCPAARPFRAEDGTTK